MKIQPRFLLVGAALLLAACVSLTGATFAAPADNPAGAEYVIERKQGDSFVEVAKGPASPLVFTTEVAPGSVITVRLRARLPDVPGSESAPSSEQSAVVPLLTPNVTGVVISFGSAKP